MFHFFISFTPEYWEIKTDEPIPPPIAIIINTMVSEYEAPTDARAYLSFFVFKSSSLLYY